MSRKAWGDRKSTWLGWTRNLSPGLLMSASIKQTRYSSRWGHTIDLVVLPDPDVAIAFDGVVEVWEFGDFCEEGAGTMC